MTACMCVCERGREEGEKRYRICRYTVCASLGNGLAVLVVESGEMRVRGIKNSLTHETFHFVLCDKAFKNDMTFQNLIRPARRKTFFFLEHGSRYIISFVIDFVL